MTNITIDIDKIDYPEGIGSVVSHYMYSMDTVTVKWDGIPDSMKLYFYYLDTEERKRFKAAYDGKKTWLADWRGDRIVIAGDRIVVAPMFFQNNVWLFHVKNDPSIRFGMDLEENLLGLYDEEDYDDEGLEQ